VRNFTSGPDHRQHAFIGREASYPDLNFIKKRIAITDVARELDLQVTGRTARCWRPESHKHGDQSPSVSFNPKTNKGRCFFCDDRSWSNIDLVMKIRDCSIREAIGWIAARFRVPEIPKGKHLAKRGLLEPYRVGTSGFPLEDVVRSGLWAAMSPAERAVLGTLCAFGDRGTGLVTISYRGIMRFAGVGSSATVSRVLSRFSKICLIDICHESAGDGLNRCSSYVLTRDHHVFQKLMRDTLQQQRLEIDAEKQIRAERRQARARERAAAHHLGPNLSSPSEATTNLTLHRNCSARFCTNLEAIGST
jgi:hypothetical protein